MVSRLTAVLAAVGVVLAGCSFGGETDGQPDPEELNVAYRAQRPVPIQFGLGDGSFGDAIGVSVNWLPYDDSGSMADALATGAADIAYGLDVNAFMDALTEEEPLLMVAVAVSFPEAENCVAGEQLELSKDNAAQVLDGTVARIVAGRRLERKLSTMLEYLGVDDGAVTVETVDGPAAIVRSLADGEISVGCAAEDDLIALFEHGTPIMTGAEHEELLGVRTYDIVATTLDFAAAHGSVVERFLSTTEDFNEAWALDRERRNPVIAAAAGIDDVGDRLAGLEWFEFPSIEEQLGPAWFGGDLVDELGMLVADADLAGNATMIADAVDVTFLEAAR